jgi:glutamine amidotransferase
MIAIVDYRAGNLSSVARALSFLGHSCEITDRAEAIARAERVILPGVGAAGATMANLRALGLDRVLLERVIGAGKPFLGICIGIQVLLDSSEENETECLGVIRGRALRFATMVAGQRLKVPQIGWNRVNLLREHPLFEGIPDGAHFYFVNSYYPDLVDTNLALAVAEYGVRFVAALACGPVMATQFHLEKSGGAGLRMLDNFCRYQAR